MAERGARLVDGGFPVVPIIPGAKCPGRYAERHGWRGMTGWCRYRDRLPTATELAIWGGWPGCGIGIPGGRVAAVDIDVTDGDLALRIEALARAELGDTPALRIGRRPKRLLVYRAEQPFRKFARHPIEFIARGAQFVAYAVHPDTGEPYRWPVDDLSELELSSLPAVREEQCRRFLDAATALLPAELRQGRLGPDPHREVYYAPAGEKRGTGGGDGRARLRPQRRPALRRLDPDRPRDEGRPRRGRPAAVRGVVGRLVQGCAGDDREGLALVPPEPDRRGHHLRATRWSAAGSRTAA